MIKQINPSRFGVIIVDMQPYFLMVVEEPERSSLIQKQVELLQICKKKDYPVVALEYEGKGHTEPELSNTIREIPRYSFFEKSEDDGFLGNEILAKVLKNWNLEYLCVSGVNAENCVFETIMGAVNQGFNPVTSRELIATATGRSGITRAEENLMMERIDYPSYELLLQQID